jgi:hypothetical protein
VGELREYLQLAQLVLILGNTMWVHGALDAINVVPEDSTKFCTPDAPQPFRTVTAGAAAWVTEMNELMQRGLLDHAARPTWDASRKSRGGEVLLPSQPRCALRSVHRFKRLHRRRLHHVGRGTSATRKH